MLNSEKDMHIPEQACPHKSLYQNNFLLIDFSKSPSVDKSTALQGKGREFKTILCGQ